MTTNETLLHWNCGDCGNMYGPDVEHCPNTNLDAAVLAKQAWDPEHDPLCPRFRLLCTCEDCAPPRCLCAVVDAVLRRDRDDLRIAFHAAR